MPLENDVLNLAADALRTLVDPKRTVTFCGSLVTLRTVGMATISAGHTDENMFEPPLCSVRVLDVFSEMEMLPVVNVNGTAYMFADVVKLAAAMIGSVVVQKLTDSQPVH